jgi:uncharacterized protein YjbI with pentapeptide repeats
MCTERRQPVPLSSKFDSWSFLRRAALCGATLCGATLCGATLCGATLCGATLCERNAPVASFFP